MAFSAKEILQQIAHQKYLIVANCLSMHGLSFSGAKVLGMKSPIAGQEPMPEPRKRRLRLLSLFGWPLFLPVVHAIFTFGVILSHDHSLFLMGMFVDGLLAWPLLAMLQLLHIHFSNLTEQLAVLGFANYLSGIGVTLFVRFLLRQVHSRREQTAKA